MVVGLASGADKIEGLNPALAAARYELYATPREIYEEGAFMAAVARQVGLIHQPGGQAIKEGHQKQQAFLEDQLESYSAQISKSPDSSLPVEQVVATVEQLSLHKTILQAAGLELVLSAA